MLHQISLFSSKAMFGAIHVQAGPVTCVRTHCIQLAAPMR